MRHFRARPRGGPRCPALARRLSRAGPEPAGWPGPRTAQPDLRLLLSSARRRRAPQRRGPGPEAADCTPGKGPAASREDSTPRAGPALPGGHSGAGTARRSAGTPSCWRRSSLLVSAPKPPAQAGEPKTPAHPHRPHCQDPEAWGPECPYRKIRMQGEPTGQAKEQGDRPSLADDAPDPPVRIRRTFALQGSCSRPQQRVLPEEDREACAPPTSTSCHGRDMPSSQSSAMDGESRLPICSDAQEPGKEVEADKPTASPPANHAPPKTPARTAAKRKTSLTSDLPLPLPLPRPVPWGRGELPPPAKLPCIEMQRDRGISEISLSPKRKNCKAKALEGRPEAVTHGSATVSASSVCPPDAGTGVPRSLPTCTADIAALPSTGNATGAHSVKTDSSNPKEGLTPKIPRGCLSAPTDSAPHNTPAANLGVRKGENEHHPLGSKATTPSTSGFPKPPPPECLPLSSPVPMSVDSPLPVSTYPPVVPKCMPCLTTETTTVFVTLAPRVSSRVATRMATHDDIVDMDTTPPSEAVIFTSPLVSSNNSYPSPQAPCSRQQGHILSGPVPTIPPTPHPYPFPQVPYILCQGHLPNGPVPTNLPPPQPYPFPPIPCSLDQGQLMMGPVPTNPPLPMVPYQHFVPQNFPSSTNVIPNVPQHSVPIPLSAVPSVPSNMGSVTVPVSGGNASSPAKSPTDDDSAMDTTPPSQASIFQSPVSMNNHPALNQMPPASNNQPHSGIISTMQGPANSSVQPQLTQGLNYNIGNLSNIRAIPQPTLGVSNGQCNNGCFRSVPALITPANGLTAPPVQLPRHTTMQSITSSSSAVNPTALPVQLPRHTTMQSITSSSSAVNPAVITPQASSTNSQSAVYTATPTTDSMKIPMLTGGGDTNSPIHQAPPGTAAVMGNRVSSNPGHSRFGTSSSGSHSDARDSHVNRRRRLQM
ncbi:nuclear pore-associated protein 1-like [Dipodomys spectabilis]|uniref:nuclear pore-associated protein 1-like n=1 Tax=Dipodomys spectabilis TaxID=105255 RepID=UPI001C538866|nr:nuclear pore-associated protein 1-like [Dipodomys spectabilis]